MPGSPTWHNASIPAPHGSNSTKQQPVYTAQTKLTAGVNGAVVLGEPFHNASHTRYASVVDI